MILTNSQNTIIYIDGWELEVLSVLNQSCPDNPLYVLATKGTFAEIQQHDLWD